MTKVFEFEETLKPFEKVEQQLNFEDEKTQVYFELQSGNPRRLISFLDDENKEILSKELPQSAFIKPYTSKAKIFIINAEEKEMKVKFRMVTGVRLL